MIAAASNRPSKTAVWLCWGLTILGCAATVVLLYGVIAAWAFRGIASLLSSREFRYDNSELLLALLPSTAAAVTDAWVLWFRRSFVPGVSRWWLAPAFAIALFTLAGAAWVCVDVWHTAPA
jgi:hypothetical protein